MNYKSHKLLIKANQLREEGEIVKSLNCSDRAIFSSELNEDILGLVESIATRSIALRIYANLHDSKNILVVSKYEMMASVKLIKKHKASKALPMLLYNLAQIEEDLGDYQIATKHYKEAVQEVLKNPEIVHRRKSVIANMQIHMFICEFKNGEKKSFEKAKKSLVDLHNSNESDKFVLDVWLSGGYLRFAEALKNINNLEAQEYLQKAKKIIDLNKDLILRRKQFVKLSKSFFLSEKN